MFKNIKQQNKASSKTGIASSGNSNKIQQNNVTENKSTLKWLIGTLITLAGVIISYLHI